MKVALYGVLGRVGSWRTVTIGMGRALRHHGVWISTRSPAEGLFVGSEETPDLAVVVGSYEAVRAARFQCPKVAWMLAPNAEQLPVDFVERVKEQRLVDCILAPSRWARSVLEQAFGPDQLIVEWPHGCSDEPVQASERQLVDKELADGRAFRVVHVTTSERQRKGTAELVRAWRSLHEADKLPPNARLMVVGNSAFWGHYRRLALELGCGFNLSSGLSGSELRDVIGGAHLVVQPSRAEGFGLVPLEARCMGVPVAATVCTGHMQHAVAGLSWIPIEHGPSAPIDDHEGATAPSVDPQAIASAIERAIDVYPAASEAARKFSCDPQGAGAWTWEQVSERPIRKLREWLGIDESRETT